MSTEVIVFGRVPLAGHVKTRLAGAVGTEAAAQIYRALLDHALAAARATGFPVTLALAEPQPTGTWRVPAGVRVQFQGTGDLGERMHRAFARCFAAGTRAAVLIGSDLPEVSAALVRQAAAALRRVPVVLGPATDGGYWLIGQRAPGVDLFSGIAWSTPQTLPATRARLARLAIPYEEVPTLSDVDTYRDLAAALTGGRVDKTLQERLAAILARVQQEP